MRSVNVFGIMRMASSALILVVACTFAVARRSPASAKAVPAVTAPVCPVEVQVRALKDHPDEALLTLWADDIAGLANGTIILYAGETPYVFPVVDAVAADIRNTKVLPTPIVVAIGAAMIDSAYVGTLSGEACGIHEPYVRSQLLVDRVRYRDDGTVGNHKVYPDWSKSWDIITSQANALTPQLLSAGTMVPAPSCQKPYLSAYMVDGATPRLPDGIRLVGGDYLFLVEFE